MTQRFPGVTNHRPDFLILTHQLAQEVDGVIDLLREAGGVVERWNLCDFPNTSATANSDGLKFGDVEHLAAATGWLHDTGAYSFAKELDGLQRELCIRECDAFWQGAGATAAESWLNDPDAILLASNKLRQLRLVHGMGIRVPDYVATNDAETVRQFAAQHRSAVAKAVRGGFVEHPEGAVKLVTRRLEITDNLLLGLRFSPLLIQEAIEKATEVRVTVVGDQAFPMAIDCSQLPADLVDVRLLDFDDQRWRFSAGPASQQLLVDSISICRALGLTYGGIDWVVDHDGNTFFLECNPMGSFKWAELTTQFPISRAISEALITLARGGSD